MARLKRGAKTRAVRDYLAEYPDASPKEIVAGLGEKGIKVKITLVNGIKYNSKKRGARHRPPSVRMAARRTRGNGVTFEQLKEVKRLADGLGGIERARQALDLLEQLQ